MIGRLRAGAKFFALGLALGLLFAPRSGQSARQELMDRVKATLPGSRQRR